MGSGAGFVPLFRSELGSSSDSCHFLVEIRETENCSHVVPRNCPCSKLECVRCQTWTPTRSLQQPCSRCDMMSSARVVLLHLLHLRFSFLFFFFFFSSSSFSFFLWKPRRLHLGRSRPPLSIRQSASCRRGWGLTLCTSSQLGQPNSSSSEDVVHGAPGSRHLGSAASVYSN